MPLPEFRALYLQKRVEDQLGYYQHRLARALPQLVRLRTGNSSVKSVTLVAEQAMALAREVDNAVAAAGEVRELTRSRSTKSSA